MPTLESIIQDYVMDLTTPHAFGSRELFLDNCYREFAVYDLYNYTNKHLEMDLPEAIVSYIHIINTIKEHHPEDKQKWSVVKLAANDILDIIEAMYY